MSSITSLSAFDRERARTSDRRRSPRRSGDERERAEEGMSLRMTPPSIGIGVSPASKPCKETVTCSVLPRRAGRFRFPLVTEIPTSESSSSSSPRWPWPFSRRQGMLSPAATPLSSSSPRVLAGATVLAAVSTTPRSSPIASAAARVARSRRRRHRHRGGLIVTLMVVGRGGHLGAGARHGLRRGDDHLQRHRRPVPARRSIRGRACDASTPRAPAPRWRPC